MLPAAVLGYALAATLLVEAGTGLLVADRAQLGGATPTAPPVGLPAGPPGLMSSPIGPSSCPDRLTHELGHDSG
ncbi:hypothetical protein GCM10020358_55940 [Amorphoplanes nipponensis]|uniref:Uncharacterized protein n=1 Tax=Actinoplanes nipponensis TaxID=135950 RepID=A0A919JMI1_9ACTN|nr:hypothetical protein Ani05nite_54460 [Actinoplanes nipponensis]